MSCRFVSIGRPLSLLVILLLLLALGLASLLTCPGLKDAGASERSDAAWYAPKRYGDEASQRYTDLVVSSRYLTMRDGVKIAIDVLLPKGLEPGAKIPAILDQTRYWRSFALRWPAQTRITLFYCPLIHRPCRFTVTVFTPRASTFPRSRAKALLAHQLTGDRPHVRWCCSSKEWNNAALHGPPRSR
jgi:hypothetical protein